MESSPTHIPAIGGGDGPTLGPFAGPGLALPPPVSPAKVFKGRCYVKIDYQGG